jgi:hypothetical protein
MDESGVHGKASPVVTVAAYVAKPRTWETFTRRWNATKRPIKVFHSSDCNAFEGEFEGWARADRDALVINLLKVVRERPMMGFVTGLDLRAYEEAMTANPDLRELLPDPYGTCFHWTVGTIMEIIEKKRNNERLAFFHENNSFHKEAYEGFDWIKANRTTHTSMMTLSFGGKDDFVPLQAADILAYEGYKLLIDPAARKRPSLVALGDNISIRWYGRENMDKLVARLKLTSTQLKVFGEGGVAFSRIAAL